MSSKVAVGIFVSAIVGANLLVAELGPWVSPINAFVLIGLDLSLRDWLHDKWRNELWRMGLLIAAAGSVSYGLNPAAGRIALASAVAFMAAAAFDAIIYHNFKDSSFLKRANYSNIGGASVDSIVFPILAFGFFPGIAGVIALQFFAKVFGGALWSVVIDKVRR